MVRSQDVAADMVQQAFVQGYSKLDRCRNPDQVGAWLFRILANRCRDHLRSPRRRDIPLQALPDIPGDRVDPSDAAARAEVRGRLQAALDELTPEQREAFVMRHLEGLSYEEIAAVMNLSVAALKMRVHRAREALRGLLEEFA
jgi:RNA polymerase sigma-70 factor (ECF subfamily)